MRPPPLSESFHPLSSPQFECLNREGVPFFSIPSALTSFFRFPCMKVSSLTLLPFFLWMPEYPQPRLLDILLFQSAHVGRDFSNSFHRFDLASLSCHAPSPATSLWTNLSPFPNFGFILAAMVRSSLWVRPQMEKLKFVVGMPGLTNFFFDLLESAPDALAPNGWQTRFLCEGGNEF